MQAAAQWLSSIFLNPRETAIASWPGDYEIEEQVIRDGETQVANVKHEGVLVLTNHRLIWVRSKGFFKKSYHPEFTIKLEDITGISMGGILFKHIMISEDDYSYKFHLVGEKDFPAFRQAIMNQSNLRKTFLESQKRQERVTIMLDFSFLKQYMEKGGLVLQTVKCSNCGATLRLPDRGSTITCSHCQSINRVEDVFEKVKSLIG